MSIIPQPPKSQNPEDNPTNFRDAYDTLHKASRAYLQELEPDTVAYVRHDAKIVMLESLKIHFTMAQDRIEELEARIAEMEGTSSQQPEPDNIDLIIKRLSNNHVKFLLEVPNNPDKSFAWSNFWVLNERGLVIWSEHSAEVRLTDLGERVVARLGGAE